MARVRKDVIRTIQKRYRANRKKILMSIISGSLPNTEQNRDFFDGSSRSVVRLRSSVIGLGTYLPGWKWSMHAGAQTGKSSENHVGYIVSGQMIVQDSNGQEQLIGPGEAFEVSPGHDAWVIGNEPCVALDISSVSNK